MNQKMIMSAVAGVIVVAGISFWGGIQYAGMARGGQSAFDGQRGNNQFAGRAGTGARFMGESGNGGFVVGEVLSVDSSSISIKLSGPTASSTNNGATGSKIVLFNGSTQIGKFTTGVSSDLKTGQMVSVQGTQNTDGSVTAQMIQIRPAGVSGSRGFGQ